MNSGPPLQGITVNGGCGLEVVPGESASEGGWTGGPGRDRAPPGASGAVRQGDANLTEDTFLP